MPPRNHKKRTLDQANNGALQSWCDAIRALEPMNARPKSFGKALILDAHRWGEAMVRAELAHAAHSGRSAESRLHQLKNGSGQSWYCKGYRLYLLPESQGAPPNLAKHQVPSPWVKQLSVDQANLAAKLAADEWWANHARTIVDELNLCVGAEKRRKAAASTDDASPATRSPAVSTPATQIISKTTLPDLPPLPSPLSNLLARPSEKECCTPHPNHLQDIVEAAVYGLRIMSCWSRNDRDSSCKVGHLGLPEHTQAHCLQVNLRAHGLQNIFGDEDGGNDEALQRVGLKQIGSGGFNHIWAVETPNETLSSLLPTEVVKPFNEGKLVLRVPRQRKTEWEPMEEIVGEMTNMLFTAQQGCGPRVAAVSFARKIFYNEDTAPQEGVPVVKYKLFAWLERATMSVDQRFDVGLIHRPESAYKNRQYYNALLVAIYNMSREGYVHCDATLRNFVDFYDLKLPKVATTFSVQVIDVERMCFRRVLPPAASTEWRSLYLFNLLTVLVFLKIKLGKWWDPAVYWCPVQRMCKQLLSELPGSHSLAAVSMWSGRFHLKDKFQVETTAEFMADTVEAASKVAIGYLRFYLLNQPYNEGMRVYIGPRKKEPAGSQKLREATAWFDHVYRATLAPSRNFFLKHYHNQSAPKRYVEVAYDFLDASHEYLKNNYSYGLSHSSTHRPGDKDELLLGVGC